MFGTQKLSHHYKNLYLIDTKACLALNPAGFIKSHTKNLLFDQVYSARSVLISDGIYLLKEMQTVLEKSNRPSQILYASKKITDHFFQETQELLTKYICELLLLKLSTQQNISDLIRENIPLFLEEVFNEEIAEKILAIFPDKSTLLEKSVHYQTLMAFINETLKTHLAENQKNLTQQITQLSSTEIKFSEHENKVIEQIEKHLSENEVRLLEARKVRIVITDKFPTKYPSSRGEFNSAKNTIHIKPQYIESSIIHEIQHSLKFDIHPNRPIQWLRFHAKCKELRLTKEGFLPLKDMHNLKELEKKWDANSDISTDMIEKAKHILTLENYPVKDRDHEVLAHLRQLIADIGAPKVEILLPSLFKFWQTEILTAIQKTKVRCL
ncbi:MAG TPA: hypothetical protein VHM20_05520 [Gammaproteobacteria bacterium]|jgi:hypothetical protein|nr:hypothetical protein [Gammaproteobacteria bacterium]